MNIRMGDQQQHMSPCCMMRRFDLFLLSLAFVAVYGAIVFSSRRGANSDTGGSSSSPSNPVFGNWLSSSNGGSQGFQQKSDIPKSLLLPTPLDFLRRGFPIAPVYNFPQRNFEGDCSCLNPKSDYECCARNFRRSHKMGTMMTEHIFDDLGIEQWNRPYYYKYMDRLPDTDYRDVLLIRNIYSTLVSGFLFHQEGNECDRTTPKGKFKKGEKYITFWYHSLSWAHPEGIKHNTMCEYLAEKPEEEALRAYIEWAMRYEYVGVLSHYALSRGLPEVRERTKVMCYEKLSSRETDQETIDDALDFWFNGTVHDSYKGTLPGHYNYTGNHATPHDPKLRGHLIDLIKKLDEELFNGEIAWLDSELPC